MPKICRDADLPTCPECGLELCGGWAGPANPKDGDTWEETCPDCDKKFSVMAAVGHWYTTEIVTGTKTLPGENMQGSFEDTSAELIGAEGL